MSWWLAILFKPFFALFFMTIVVLPLKLLFLRFLPEGPIKDVLFIELNGAKR